jgi:TolB-like protein
VQALSSADIFLFEGFRLDRRGLFRGDEDAEPAPVEIGSRALEVLRALAERPGDLLSRHEIMAAAWPGMVIDDNNLTIQIATLRRVLDHGRTEGSCILTVPGRGYRLVAPVARVGPAGKSILPAPRLSIVVLPFSNLSDDPEQQYFADGITEDLTTDLSRLPHMSVISRNTAFTYRNKRIDTRQIGVELGARYVLQGSVRRSGHQARVSAQLIDAATDTCLWAERFDCDTVDLFALQNEITGRIAIELNIELIAAEAARPTVNPEALDYIFRGRAVRLRPNSRDVYAQAVHMFERALALDPRSVEAQSLLASALATRMLDGVTDSEAADLARAEGLVNQALAASPRSPTAHMAKGDVLRARGRSAEAIAEYEMVLRSIATTHMPWTFSRTASC